jgi:hypothetical protein
MSVSRAKPRGIRISGDVGPGNFTMQELRPHDETLCGGDFQGESAENLASGPFPGNLQQNPVHRHIFLLFFHK